MAGMKVKLAKMRLSLTQLPSKYDWPEIILVGVVGGGFSFGMSMLWRTGLEKNAVFAFLGAIVGTAAVVFFSIGQQDRQQHRSAARERAQIKAYITAAGRQIDEHVKALFAAESDASDQMGRLITGCEFAIYSIDNLRGYLAQAIQYASYQGFLARAHLLRSVEACDHATNELGQIIKDADEFDKDLDLSKGRSAIVHLHNTMNNLPDN